jgi:predicted HTH transcriptional regulator
MACDTPERYLSSAFIQAVYYRGTERNAMYQLDAKDITGPLDLPIKDACVFVEKNMRVFATKAPHRIDFPQF